MNLTLVGVPVGPAKVANTFAKHFSDKIRLNVGKTMVNANGVYNGKCKLIVQNRNFITMSDVRECMADLNNKSFISVKKC